MKKSLFQKIINLSTQEYDIFFQLPLQSRIKGVLALMLFYTTFILISHLAVRPFLEDSPSTFMSIYVFYSLFILFFLIFSLPILNPGLRKYRVAFLIGSILFCIIISFMIDFSTSGGIFQEKPDSTVFLLWALGACTISSGITLYGKLMKKISTEKARIETEIKVAQDIQSQLVPSIEKDEKNYQIFGKTTPAQEVGGDFFDAVELPNNKLMVAVGDVSGHNVAAGLLMAITKGAFHTELQYISTLENLAKSMNKTILKNSNKKMFVTFSCGLFDFENNLLTTINAGHLPLLHYQNSYNKIVEWNPDGMAFGLSKGVSFHAQEISFQNGDVFLFFSDGLVEAKNATGEEFDIESVKYGLQNENDTASPKMLYEKIISDFKQFTNSQSLVDDVTFVTVKIV